MEKLDMVQFIAYPSINSKVGMKTNFGGYLSSVLIIITVLCFIAFGNDLLYKNKPVVFSSESLNNEPIIKRKDFRAAIAGLYAGGKEIPELDRMVEFKTYNVDVNSTRTPFTITTINNCDKCSERNDLNIYKNANITSQFLGTADKYQCLSSKVTSNLEGTFGKNDFKTWYFVLTFCTNSTSNNNSCLPKEIIQDKLKVFFVHLVWTNFYIDSSDFEEPVKFNYDSTLLRVSSLSNRRDTFMFKTLQYYSDSGFIMEKTTEYLGFSLSKHDVDNTYDPNTVEIFRLTITNDPFQSKIFRSYTKIQKVAADIGGIIKFFSIIFAFLSNKYGELKFYEYLINFFSSEERNESRNDSQKIIKEIPKIILNDNKYQSHNDNNRLVNNFIDNSTAKFQEQAPNEIQAVKMQEGISKNNKIRKEAYVTIIKNNSSNEHKIVFQTKILDIILFYFCCENENTKILKEVKKKFTDKLSVEQILMDHEFVNEMLSSYGNQSENLEKVLSKRIFG